MDLAGSGHHRFEDFRRELGAEWGIFVGNLPSETTSDDLGVLFSEFGIVEWATVSRQRKSGRLKGYGFVDIRENKSDAAIDALHGASLSGRQLTVRPARYVDPS